MGNNTVLFHSLNATRRRSIRRGLIAVVAGAVWLGIVAAPAPAAAQTVATKYARAAAREKAARAAKPPSAASLRAIAQSYEAIVRAHPRSGYSDNALWQASGLFALAYDRTGARSDRDQSLRLLTWLRNEYPTGALAKQATAKIAALRAPAKPTAPRAAATPPPPAAEPPAPSSPVRSAEPTRPAPRAPMPSTAAPPRIAVAAPADAPAVLMAPVALPPAPAVMPITAPAVIASRDSGAAIKTVTHSSLPRGDRLTIELSGEALYSASRLANPDRVTLHLPNSGAASSLAERVSAISGRLIKSVSIASATDTSTRLELQLAGGPRFSTFPLYNPFRLVIDFESDAVLPPPAVVAAVSSPRGPALSVESRPTDYAARTAAAAVVPASTPSPLDDDVPAPTSAASTSRGDYSMARQLGLSVSRIVIDPGHGGHDPGASANGVGEADLVLDVARRVETLLRAQPGVEVVLTRRNDTFIPLEERTAIANRERADLFVSIHANSSPRAATRGVETYFLDFASNPEAEALAARENATSQQTMRLLPEIVKTITLTNKLDESRELARMVQSSLVQRLGPLSKGLKDLGVKRAPFVVLIGAQMPSVLAEISFLTNRTDASLLKQADHRQRIARALADAILKYQASLKSAPAPRSRTAAR